MSSKPWSYTLYGGSGVGFGALSSEISKNNPLADGTLPTKAAQEVTNASAWADLFPGLVAHGDLIVKNGSIFLYDVAITEWATLAVSAAGFTALIIKLLLDFNNSRMDRQIKRHTLNKIAREEAALA